MPFVIAVVVAAGLIALLDVRLEGHRSFPVKSRPWYLQNLLCCCFRRPVLQKSGSVLGVQAKPSTDAGKVVISGSTRSLLVFFLLGLQEKEKSKVRGDRCFCRPF